MTSDIQIKTLFISSNDCEWRRTILFHEELISITRVKQELGDDPELDNYLCTTHSCVNVEFLG